MNGKANLVGWGAFVAGAIFLFLALPAQAKYAGGTGTAEDPYLIGTAEQMNVIGLSPEDWVKQFRLVADVDMNDLVPMNDSFWDIVTSGLDTSDGGIGKTTAQMQDRSTYIDAGWDFEGETLNGSDDTWKMRSSGATYPKLAWETTLP